MICAAETHDGRLHAKVSIGVPVYNGERYLREALESLLAQTFSDLEIIVSDNCSTDSTKEICEEYESKDDRIRYYQQEKNIGLSANFNFVYGKAKGTYFKWAPHDDVLHPNFVGACVSLLEKDSSIVLCQSVLRYIDENGEEIGLYDCNLEGSDSCDPGTRFGAAVCLPHPGYDVMGVFRRDALQGSLLIAGIHNNDKALVAEMALRGRSAHIDEPLLLVRDHPQRYTRSKVRPRERLLWNNPNALWQISLPTWRLYCEYVKMIARNVPCKRTGMKCYWHLLRWWGCNWNAARMGTDLLAVVFPGIVERAESFKQKHFGPAPGAQQARRDRDNPVY